MNMNEVIARINELAAKNKAEGLTEAELEERAKLRRIYIDNVTGNLKGHSQVNCSVLHFPVQHGVLFLPLVKGVEHSGQNLVL